MDIRTGRTYETREAGIADGVPESDLAHIHEQFRLDGKGRRVQLPPKVTFSKGSFKPVAHEAIVR